MDNISNRIEKMLLKRALGYKVSEVVEEYGTDKDEGDMKLLKRKITTKHIPPDITAGKILIELNKTVDDDDISKLSSAQLNDEKARLISLLKDYPNDPENEED